MSGPLPLLWLDGELMALDDATISPTNHGLTVGDGVFETLKVVHDTPFALTRHLGRLRGNAAAMGLTVPADDSLREAASLVIAANRGATKLRITVTSGSGPAGSTRGGEPATVVVFADDTPLGTGPVRVVTVPWCRNERGALAGLKTTSYAENVLALRHAQAAGADEALFANTRDELCEGTGTNVFVVIDDELCTPPIASGCLAGVTRALVLESVDVNEVTVPMGALASASEMFVTSSTRDVTPVTAVDDHVFAAVPGPLTRAAADAFAALARDLDP